jgi:hypothetical protein
MRFACRPVSSLLGHAKGKRGNSSSKQADAEPAQDWQGSNGNSEAVTIVTFVTIVGRLYILAKPIPNSSTEKSWGDGHNGHMVTRCTSVIGKVSADESPKPLHCCKGLERSWLGRCIHQVFDPLLVGQCIIWRWR